jgi:uncharacterized membrane protein YccC
MIPPRGTARTPGAHPGRLAIGLDLRAISIVEGVRAGLAAALPVAASVWLGEPVLTMAALGALLTCICDPGGPISRRLPVLCAFVAIGAVLLGGFGLLRGVGIGACVAVAAPVLFITSYIRIWGQSTQALGNLLAVVLVLGTDDALGWQAAGRQGAVFAAGGVWALLLTLLIWRIYPFGPARRAVADVWVEMARMTRAMQALTARQAGAEDWEAHSRASRFGVRAAIERARDILMSTLNARGPTSSPAAQSLLRLEAADQVFAALIALFDLLEQAPQALRQEASGLLRRLRALLTVLAGAAETEALDRVPRIERSLAALEAAGGSHAALAVLARAIAERLRQAMRLVDPAQTQQGNLARDESGGSWRARIIGKLTANLSWRSATLRHALRSTLVVSAALAATLVWHGPYTHWLTITLVLVMQPFFALTWQRSLERVGGTLLGGLIAAALSALLQTRLHVAGLLPVLGALALAVRQVSYGVYIAVYTPTVIFLVESFHPAESQMRIALARAGFTILGGLIAVVANMLLWPSWEPDQVRKDLQAAIAAHAAYARDVLGGAPGAAHDRSRRGAGLASNNLEASLARAMQEPRRGQRNRLQNALVADATLRRIAGRLSAMALERAAVPAELRRWVPAALAALAEGGEVPAPPQAGPDGTSDRLAQQVSLLAGVIARTREIEADPAAGAAPPA